MDNEYDYDLEEAVTETLDEVLTDFLYDDKAIADTLERYSLDPSQANVNRAKLIINEARGRIREMV